jgi:O-acetyl-ADP-ribose deacetylase (regulator of RNase III)
MLHETSGDILLTRAQAIAHGVGPEDHFTHGLALALREQWPAMSRDFRHWAHLEHPQPGRVWMWGGVGRHRIFCLVTQEAGRSHDHPGRAHVEHVNHCLRELRRQVEAEGITSLALPRLATGVGGLDWQVVRPLIDHHLGALKIPVYIYGTFKAGVTAPEPGLIEARRAAP